MLILVGSGVIAFEAIRHLVLGSKVERLGIGLAVVAVSAASNLVVGGIVARRAQRTESAALEGDAAHLRTDALTSLGVLVGLGLVQVTGADWIDPVVALAVAGAIVVSGVRILTRSSRVLVDEALPDDDQRAIDEAVRDFGPRGVAGYHNLRTRRAGARPSPPKGPGTAQRNEPPRPRGHRARRARPAGRRGERADRAGPRTARRGARGGGARGGGDARHGLRRPLRGARDRGGRRARG